MTQNLSPVMTAALKIIIKEYMKRLILSSFFIILNINAILAFDSLVSLLDFENKPGIDYYNKLFKENDFNSVNDTLWMSGEPKYSREFFINHTEKNPFFYITLHYTTKSRLVYCAHITCEVNKDRFVKELLAFYSDLIDKYNLPDSAYYQPDGYYKSPDMNEYFAVELVGGKDTTKVRQFFEQARPFCIIWAKERSHVSLMVDEKYNAYSSPDFTCTIIDNKGQSIHSNEMSEIEAKKQQREIMLRWITIGIAFVGILFILFLGFIIIKDFMKRRDIDKKRQMAEEERHEKLQRKADNEHEGFISELKEKYGSITRTIPFERYDDYFVKHHDDILVFEQPKKIFFGKTEYNFSDILNCSIYDENQKDAPLAQVTRTKTGSMLGRAVIGGLTLGVAGAVVGAMTATKETQSSAANSDYAPFYIVKIGVKSIENPVITLHFYRDKEQAETLYAVMQTIIAMK